MRINFSPLLTESENNFKHLVSSFNLTQLTHFLNFDMGELCERFWKWEILQLKSTIPLCFPLIERIWSSILPLPLPEASLF